MKQDTFNNVLPIQDIYIKVTDGEGNPLTVDLNLRQLELAYCQNLLQNHNITTVAKIMMISRDRVYRMIRKGSLNTPKSSKRKIEAQDAE